MAPSFSTARAGAAPSACFVDPEWRNAIRPSGVSVPLAGAARQIAVIVTPSVAFMIRCGDDVHQMPNAPRRRSKLW